MALKIHNSLSQELEVFTPINAHRTTFYSCGPTVYNFAHIGNFRAFIFADTVKRVLTYLGYPVFHVMNFTDVEDKIIRAHQESGQSLRELTDPYIQAFVEDIGSLNIIPADKYTKATDYIEEMVVIIERLLNQGYAYKTADGSVYFDLSKDENYGKLVRIDHDAMKENAKGRMKNDEYDKDNVQDFSLWKAWDEADGSIFWETRLGKGRPGWHIECSAMAMKTLGETIDIHTGGVDNKFPHHENEIAQSECATGKEYARYFMHNEWVLVEGKKMSKSFNNFYTLRDIAIMGHNPIAFRYLLLTAHYRTSINFSFDALTASSTALEKLLDIVEGLPNDGIVDQGYEKKFAAIIENDFDTAGAIALIWILLKDDSVGDADKKATILDCDRVLGLGLEKKDEFVVPLGIQNLIKERDTARKNEDWTTSDALRNEIKKLGYKIKDTEGGVHIKRITKPQS